MRPILARLALLAAVLLAATIPPASADDPCQDLGMGTVVACVKCVAGLRPCECEWLPGRPGGPFNPCGLLPGGP